MQAPVLLTHCHLVALRNFVYVHRNLHHRSIQRAKGVQEFVNVVRLEAVRAQLSPLPFLRLGHRIPFGVNSASCFRGNPGKHMRNGVAPNAELTVLIANIG